jgi:hypothetical protein
MKAMARISARSLPLIGLHVIATISLETLIREMITRLEGDTSSGRPDHPVLATPPAWRRQWLTKSMN